MTPLDLIHDSRRLLAEVTPVEFSQEDLLSFANAGEREIVEHVPNSNTNSRDFVCVANQALQALPAGVLRLVDVVRNTGADGVSYGRAVKRSTVGELSRWDRDWMTSTADVMVRNFVYDEDRPAEFFIYPRLSSGLHLQLKTTDMPVPRTSYTQQMTISDRFRNPLVWFMVGTALSRLGSPASGAVADAWLGKFVAWVAECNNQDSKQRVGEPT